MWDLTLDDIFSLARSYILLLTIRLSSEKTVTMSSHADNKDRQFLAVIGDEVGRDAISAIDFHADRDDNRTL